MIKKTTALCLIILMIGIALSSFCYADQVYVTTIVPEFFNLTVNGGQALVDGIPVVEATKGTAVVITADKPDSGYQFYQWTAVSLYDYTFTDNKSATTSFVMPACDIEITAEYVLNGDIDGNGKIGLADVVRLLVSLINPGVKTIASTDVNHSGHTDTGDVIHLVKYILGYSVDLY